MVNLSRRQALPIGVGNSAPATSVGSVVPKIEMVSSTGASLGWIPVYGAIT